MKVPSPRTTTGSRLRSNMLGWPATPARASGAFRRPRTHRLQGGGGTGRSGGRRYLQRCPCHPRHRRHQGAELISALNRRARDGSISEDEYQLLRAAFALHLIRDYLVAAVEPAHITTACELIERHALRAYDAVQLAVAIAVRRKLLGASAEPFRFVSADADLTAAAKAEGMSVVEP
jgi:predicted nucleic acid-binding protein